MIVFKNIINYSPRRFGNNSSDFNYSNGQES